jgi:hypothetical protein
MVQRLEAPAVEQAGLDVVERPFDFSFTRNRQVHPI